MAILPVVIIRALARKASTEDLRAVEGIGPKLATELALFLKEGKVKK